MTVCATPAQRRFLRLANAERARHGLVPMALEARLHAAAGEKAAAMARTETFGHGDAAGLRTKHGYQADYESEIILYGQATPDAALKGWLDSPVHRAQLLNPNHRYIGVGGPEDPDWSGPGDVYQAWCCELGSAGGDPVPPCGGIDSAAKRAAARAAKRDAAKARRKGGRDAEDRPDRPDAGGDRGGGAAARPVGIGAPTGTVPKGQIGGGGPWALVNRWDAVFVAEGKKHNAPPDMLKAMMIVESGGKTDAADRFGASGAMQIKAAYWGDRAKAAGYDLATTEGQIGMAAAIVGGSVPGVAGETPAARFLSAYYPIAGGLDARGESGHTQRMYLEDVALYSRLIREAGGGPAAPKEPAPTPAPSGATPLRTIAVVGFPGVVRLQQDIGFRQVLTPLDRVARPNDRRPGANRSGASLRATGTRYHETGNPRPGTGADMHARWQFNGTEGHPDGRVGVHFYVDDREVLQCIPVDEQGVHSGDAGNQTQLAVEQCIATGSDVRMARRNAICLHAALLRDVIRRTATAAMWRHHDGLGCPATINRDGTWPTIESEVDRLIREGA